MLFRMLYYFVKVEILSLLTAVFMPFTNNAITDVASSNYAVFPNHSSGSQTYFQFQFQHLSLFFLVQLLSNLLQVLLLPQPFFQLLDQLLRKHV